MSLQRIVPSTESYVIFAGLDSGTSYTISVYATTSVGSGQPNITVIPPLVQSSISQYYNMIIIYYFIR